LVKFLLPCEPRTEFRIFLGKFYRGFEKRVRCINTMRSDGTQIFFGLFSGHLKPPSPRFFGRGIPWGSPSEAVVSARLNCSFPRESRDITVSIGTPKAAEISL